MMMFIVDGDLFTVRRARYAEHLSCTSKTASEFLPNQSYVIS